MEDAVLVTGCAGFIGFHLASRLLELGKRVVGVDDLNGYYDPKLKMDRLRQLEDKPLFTFYRCGVEQRDALDAVFRQHRFGVVIHLAAQAGVRYSLENPQAYVQSNLVGFVNVLEMCRHHEVGHLLYASSSSVYGANHKLPFSVHDPVDHPLSLYAATKRSNELMAHTYSHLFGLPTTGLRFFTVYGPWGRPDMAPMLFTDAIFRGKPIRVFNHGKMSRDFTYIGDAVEAIVRLLYRKPRPNPLRSPQDRDPSDSRAPFKLYNIGNNQPVELERFIAILEEKIGRRAIREDLPLQDGDVVATFADTNELIKDTGFQPSTGIEEGVERLVHWYKEYYNVV